MPKVPTNRDRIENIAQMATVAAGAVATVAAAWNTATKALGDGGDGNGVFGDRREKRKQRATAVRYAQMVHGRILIDALGPNDERYAVVFEDGEPSRSFPKSDVPFADWQGLEHVRPEDLSDPESLSRSLRRGR